MVDNGNGTFTYSPNGDFNGSDSFTYSVSDGNGGTADSDTCAAHCDGNTIGPAVYSGQIVIAGGIPMPESGKLVARVDDYESEPAAIDGNGYNSLVVDPGTENFIGMPVIFFLNGIQSAPPSPSVNFTPGEFRTVNLVFTGFPTPEPALASP